MHTTIKQRRGTNQLGTNQQGTDYSAGNVANLQGIRRGKVQQSRGSIYSLHRNTATLVQEVRRSLHQVSTRLMSRRNQLIQLFNCCALIFSTVGFIVASGLFQAFLICLVVYFIAAIVVRTKR
jgi:hypothetical protein